MRIDFSEPECSNCYHCRTSGILNTRESGPSNVIGSPITSLPVSAGPAQALGHDSASVGSTSTSSLVQPLGHVSSAVGSTSRSSSVQGSSPFSSRSAPAATTSVSAGPAQSLDPTILSTYGAFGAPSQRPAFQGTSGFAASPTFIPSTSSTFHSSSPFRFGSAPAVTPVSSAPTQALGPTTFGLGASAVSTPPRFGSMQAPVQDTSGSGASATSTSSTSSPVHSSSPFGFAPAVTSVSSAPTNSLNATTFGFGAYAVPTPPRFGSMQAPGQDTFGSGASNTSTFFSFLPFGSIPPPPPSGSPLFGTAQNMPWSANPFYTGCGTEWVRPDVGVFPASSSSSTTTVVFGTTPVSVSSLYGPAQDFPKTTSVCASSTSAPTGCGIAFTRSGFGSSPASSSLNIFGPNPSTTASVSGTSTANVSSFFQPAQHPLRSGVPKLTSVFAPSTPKNPVSSLFPGFGVDYLPGSSFSPFGQNPPTTTPCFGGGSVLAGVKTSTPQPFGFSGATTLLSSSPSSSPSFGWNPNMGSHRTEGSRYPGYAPTPTTDEQKGGIYEPKGGIYISISASNSYLHKSHEELRWEDYKQGVKGGSFPAAHVSPTGSRPNAFFSPSTTSPSIFASPNVPDQPQKTTFATTQGNMTGPSFFFPAGGNGFRQPNAPVTGFGTQFPSLQRPHETGFGTQFPSLQRPHETGFGTQFPSLQRPHETGFGTQFPSFQRPHETGFGTQFPSFQRPHETANVSSTASGCTACGATSSSSASGHFTFNGATTPPSAATSLPGLFFPTSGSGPMMFGTNLAAQVTTPALRAYPVQGYILLPFAAMSLQ